MNYQTTDLVKPSNSHRDGEIDRCDFCNGQIDPTFTSTRCIPFCQVDEHRTRSMGTQPKDPSRRDPNT